jgi:Cu-Zn family superoxide dismutase
MDKKHIIHNTPRLHKSSTTPKTIPPNKGIAIFNTSHVHGVVHFIETNNDTVQITVQLSGLTPNHKHGFHVHEYGDMSERCESMCGHFNPYGKTHGDQTDKERHVGDLGNLQTDENGNVSCIIYDKFIRLRGTKANIIGRGLIIHADTDDCGRGKNTASKINGNAGKRIACSVIGYAR